MPWDQASIDAALRADGELCARLANQQPAMARIRDEVLVPAIRANFATESAAGDAWPELADATLDDRARKGFPPGPILERTGDLLEASTGHREVGPDYAEVGLEEGHPYGKYHVSSRPRSKIPLRDFLAITRAEVDRAGEILADFVERGVA